MAFFLPQKLTFWAFLRFLMHKYFTAQREVANIKKSNEITTF
jgi:hypothetical protein